MFSIRYSLHFLALICSFFFVSCQPKVERVLPNIILILADDMGYSDIGYFGSEIPTPNIDFLAENGLVMTQFYNAARCCPTRASLLTGLYPHNAGMGDMVEGRLRQDSTFLPAYQGWLKESSPTLAEVLKPGGYQSFISGKWHVGDEPDHWPDRRGFDRSFSLINGASNYFNLSPWIHQNQEIILALDGEKITPKEEFYMTTAISGNAMNFLDERDPERPFFLYLPFTAPHWPLHALPEDIQKFEGTYLGGWDSLRAERFAQQRAGDLFGNPVCLTEPYFRNPQLTPSWNQLSAEEKKTWDRRMAVYAAQVFRMDQEIGRIIEKLRDEGIIDNTLIMFLSDNGATQAAIYLATSWYADRSGEIGTARSFDSYGASWANVSNTPFQLFKHWTTEGGIATPFIAFWPDEIKHRLERNQYGHVIDILPTIVDVAGLSPVSDLQTDGESLSPVFSGKPPPGDRVLFWEHQGNWAVRQGDWKLVFTREVDRQPVNRLELFNIRNDRAECVDVSSSHPERVEQYRNMYEQWAEQTGVEPWDSLILARNL